MVYKAISCQCSPFITPENFRKPLFFNVQGLWKGNIALKCNNHINYVLEFSQKPAEETTQNLKFETSL